MSYQTQVLDCQFQMRMVWSSEALRIHGYSYVENDLINCIQATRCWLCADEKDQNYNYFLVAEKKPHMVKEGGSDVIKVSKEGEEAASQFVVPHLVKTGILTQRTKHNIILWNCCLLTGKIESVSHCFICSYAFHMVLTFVNLYTEQSGKPPFVTIYAAACSSCSDVHMTLEVIVQFT